MEKSNELIVAKINATIKILEWAKDDLEPGIGGTPRQLHAALAEAFRAVYRSISEAVAADVVEAQTAQTSAAVPIGSGSAGGQA